MKDVPHPELAEIILDESGYTGMWQNDKSVNAPGRLENLREVIHAMAEFENMDEFLEDLEEITAISDQDTAFRCVECNFECTEDAEFCPQCGVLQVVVCCECNCTNKISNEWCQKCIA